MNAQAELERAILLVLCASRGRAIDAATVHHKLPQFIDGASIADVKRSLKALERTDPPEVKGTFSRDFGMLWKETDDGRLRIS